MTAKPRLGVFKFASCDGCQLSLLACEDQLLGIASAVEIAYFLEATSRIQPGPYDIALVEGSITTEHDMERILQIRRDSKLVVTIGACATSGGIQALRNWADCDEFVKSVYASPEYISTLSTSTAIAEHIKVDFELRGCPIDQQQLIDVIQSLLAGRRPRTPAHCVCLDCKRSGTVCVMVAQGISCLGPVTQAGCGAICPTYNRGCYGCFGLSKHPNLISLTSQLANDRVPREQIVRSLRGFNGNATEFRVESDRIEKSLETNK
jgi:sulfhydrogenase subunit delta